MTKMISISSVIRPLKVRQLDHPELMQKSWGFFFAQVST